MTENSKGTSILYCRINYGHKKFYDTDHPPEVFNQFLELSNSIPIIIASRIVGKKNPR